MVMKFPFGKTYLKTIAREIRLSLGRFFAIFGIVALGVGFLAGLLATTPDMKASVDRYFDTTDMMDILIKGTMGFSDGDIAAVGELPEVEQVQGAFVTDALVRTSWDETLVSRIYGLPLESLATEAAFINRMELLAGRMPQRDDECLVQEGGGFFVNIPIGTILTIADENTNDDLEQLSDRYRVTNYTVTGIVRSPLFLSFEREPAPIGNGRLAAAIFVREACYALPARTDLYLTLQNAAALTSLSAPYNALVDAATTELEVLGEARSQVRRAEIRAEAVAIAEEAFARAEAEYVDGRNAALAELAAAQKKLDDVEAEMLAGEAELLAGEAELADAATQTAAGRAALLVERRQFDRTAADNEAALRNGEAEIAAAKRTLAERKAQLDAAKDEVEKTRASRTRMANARAREGVAQYDAGVKAWEEGVATVAEKERELQQGRRLLEAGTIEAAAQFAAAEAKLDAAEEDIARGLAELAEARTELEQGRLDYVQGRLDYERGRLEAEEKLRRGAEELEAGRQKRGDIEIPLPEWYVLDRNFNVGAANFDVNAEKIEDVAKVFPIFFLLVAALVALTTMTRMVEEERTQIGILKALGYQKRVIAAKYLVYCGLTSILGSVVGMAGGFQGLPIIIYNAFGTRYHLPPIVLQFNWPFGLIAMGIMMACTMGVTITACYTDLREKPAALMLPRSPKPGKRIFLEYLPFIWKHMKFTYKVTARNIIRYKKHFFMTVTGIAGCTALMVAGFGLRNSVTDIARTQFTEILGYDLQIELKEDEGWDDVLTTFLSAPRYTPIHTEPGTIINTGSKNDMNISASIYVAEAAAAFGDYIHLRIRQTRAPIPFTPASVVITEKMAAEGTLAIGDILTLENADGIRGACVLTGITENYVGNYVYLGKDAYGDMFGGGDCAYTTLLVQTDITAAAEQDSAIAAILASDVVMGAEFTSRSQESFNNLLASINFVVMILIFAAGGLAMIVLYNLTNININERSRELATLRVLGFHQGEAAAYIFREITVLSIAGATAGLFIGIPLHRFIIGVAENVDLMFGRHISAASFVLSAVITLVFSAGVDLLMVKKIRNIRMAESMKAAD
ncbi:ABC transporter permease [Spirochaetia bacterium]|nr:ABC transporter permease [Spirochaetia bacterium]